MLRKYIAEDEVLLDDLLKADGSTITRVKDSKIPTANTYIFEKDGNIQGFFTWEMMDNGEPFINHLYVFSEFRGKFSNILWKLLVSTIKMKGFTHTFVSAIKGDSMNRLYRKRFKIKPFRETEDENIYYLPLR